MYHMLHGIASAPSPTAFHKLLKTSFPLREFPFSFTVIRPLLVSIAFMLSLPTAMSQG
jgi:hypothetical protein